VHLHTQHRVSVSSEKITRSLKATTSSKATQKDLYVYTHRANSVANDSIECAPLSNATRRHARSGRAARRREEGRMSVKHEGSARAFPRRGLSCCRGRSSSRRRKGPSPPTHHARSRARNSKSMACCPHCRSGPERTNRATARCAGHAGGAPEALYGAAHRGPPRRTHAAPIRSIPPRRNSGWSCLPTYDTT
jgi:hypothetical protein